MALKPIDFFRELGLELEGRATIEGEWAGRVTGLSDQRVEIAMMRTPDGHGRLELSRFLTPTAMADHRNAPVNALGYLRVMFAVDDIDETFERLRERGAQLVGEVVQYKDAYRSATSAGPKAFSSDSPRNSAEIANPWRKDRPALKFNHLTRRSLFPNLTEWLTYLCVGAFLHFWVKQNEILVLGFGLSESLRITLSKPADCNGELRFGLILAGGVCVDKGVQSKPRLGIIAVLDARNPTLVERSIGRGRRRLAENAKALAKIAAEYGRFSSVHRGEGVARRRLNTG